MLANGGITIARQHEDRSLVIHRAQATDQNTAFHRGQTLISQNRVWFPLLDLDHRFLNRASLDHLASTKSRRQFLTNEEPAPGVAINHQKRQKAAHFTVA